jgi:serine phosphatase RsbU (regulator of sigma subunit)
VVFQSARKRLLATLCYAVLDPRRREMQYASAGHLFPYRVSPEGRVDSLESVSYPLGVRDAIDIVPRAARLSPGDLVVLFSDGLVEARGEDSEEPYGFDRLEEALRRQAGRAPAQVRETLLDEVRRFTKDAPREDDLTMLILRMPA